MKSKIFQKIRRDLKICFSAVMLLSFVSQPMGVLASEKNAQVLQEQTNGQAINKGIADLEYNKNEVLAAKGDSIESFIPKEGTKTPDKFIVVERIKRSLTSSPVDISVIDSMKDRTYPGALQLANSDFVDNQPNLLITKRKPMNISVDLPGLGKNNVVEVRNPNYSNITGAIDEQVTKWLNENSNSRTLPARMQYNETMVYSKSQLATALNINASDATKKLGIDFNAVQSGEKKVMVVAYKQIFYTVSAELPNNPSDLFDESVTFEELTRKGVSKSAPPVLVSNVAYGRTIYVKLETTSKSNNVKAAFSAAVKSGFKNVDVNSNVEYKNILNNSSFTAVVLGGDAEKHNMVVTKDFDKIRDVILNNSKFSAKNPGYPISYTSTFIKDNAVAAIHNKTEYVETKSTEYSKGKITLEHYGAYVAQFVVSWDEFSYDEQGKEKIVHKNWGGNWSDRTAHFSTEIPLPPNSKNIRIMARECTGLAWEWWRTVVNEYNVPLTNNIKVEIGGTTLYPSKSVTYK